MVNTILQSNGLLSRDQTRRKITINLELSYNPLTPLKLSSKNSSSRAPSCNFLSVWRTSRVWRNDIIISGQEAEFIFQIHRPWFHVYSKPWFSLFLKIVYPDHRIHVLGNAIVIPRHRILSGLVYVSYVTCQFRNIKPCLLDCYS